MYTEESTFIVGIIDKEPELRYVGKGVPLLKFSLRTSKKIGDEWKTKWTNITVFGKLAEYLNDCKIGPKDCAMAWGQYDIAKKEWKGKPTTFVNFIAYRVIPFTPIVPPKQEEAEDESSEPQFSTLAETPPINETDDDLPF